jgi:uncharacterized membrane protein YjgN (DUF898 family)
LQGLFFLVVLVLWGAAIYRARRYQLSRTLWRGIRGTLEGSSATYSLLYFGSMLASGMTLGWATPAMNTTLQKTIIGDMRFGSMPFYFRGRAGPLYPTYAVCWFLSLIFFGLAIFAVFAIAQSASGDLGQIFSDLANSETDTGDGDFAKVGIIASLLIGAFVIYAVAYPVIWSFYTAKELNTFASYTEFGDARFSLTATSWKLIKLVIGNFFIWLFTLGIAAPFVQQRVVRFLCDNLDIRGTVNVDRILQSKATIDRRGEGLADAFDVGGI